MRESVTYKELVAESEARGREQERRRVACQMLTMGMTNEQVAQILELTPEQVRQIQTVPEEGSFLLNRVPIGETDPLEGLIGSVESGIPDWTDKHDLYLGEDLNKSSQSR
jgi:hypothetical protein